jgi:hypothetical protein
VSIRKVDEHESGVGERNLRIGDLADIAAVVNVRTSGPIQITLLAVVIWSPALTPKSIFPLPLIFCPSV